VLIRSILHKLSSSVASEVNLSNDTRVDMLIRYPNELINFPRGHRQRGRQMPL
jgi:hypothetical protein